MRRFNGIHQGSRLPSDVLLEAAEELRKSLFELLDHVQPQAADRSTSERKFARASGICRSRGS